MLSRSRKSDKSVVEHSPKVETGSLLLELICEDLPASVQRFWLQNAPNLLQDILRKHKLEFGDSKDTHCVEKSSAAHCVNSKQFSCCTTPSRLVLSVENIPTHVKLDDKIINGPKVGVSADTKSRFLAVHKSDESHLTVVKKDHGTVYQLLIPGDILVTSDVLPKLLLEFLRGIKWPVTMKWGDYELRWPRPLFNICAVFAGKKIDFKFGHLSANYYTFIPGILGYSYDDSHRVIVCDFSQYKHDLLHKGHVCVSNKKRLQIIEKKMKTDLDKLLFFDVNCVLEIEYPVVILSSVDIANSIKFYATKVPILISHSVLHTEQSAIIVNDVNSKIQFYVIVGYAPGKHFINNVTQGLQKAAYAKLSDVFFMLQDDSVLTADTLQKKLCDLEFHPEIGTMWARIQRVQHCVSKVLSASPPNVCSVCSVTTLQNVFFWLNMDLVTQTVYEQPNLHGLVAIYMLESNPSFFKDVEQKNYVFIFKMILMCAYPVSCKSWSELGRMQQFLMPSEDNIDSFEWHSIVGGGQLSVLLLVNQIDTLIGYWLVGGWTSRTYDPFGVGRILQNVRHWSFRLYILLNPEDFCGLIKDCISVWVTLEKDSLAAKYYQKLQKESQDICQKITDFVFDYSWSPNMLGNSMHVPLAAVANHKNCTPYALMTNLYFIYFYLSYCSEDLSSTTYKSKPFWFVSYKRVTGLLEKKDENKNEKKDENKDEKKDENKDSGAAGQEDISDSESKYIDTLWNSHKSCSSLWDKYIKTCDVLRPKLCVRFDSDDFGYQYANNILQVIFFELLDGINTYMENINEYIDAYQVMGHPHRGVTVSDFKNFLELLFDAKFMYDFDGKSFFGE